MTALVTMGIGLSSRATQSEVRSLVEEVLADLGATLDDVRVIATRDRFVDDARLVLGPPVVGFSDAQLEAASAPPERSTGIRAKVAETAALLATDGPAPRLLGPVRRSPHATAALARSSGPETRR